jgi:hypothetical protein
VRPSPEKRELKLPAQYWKRKARKRSASVRASGASARSLAREAPAAALPSAEQL